MKKKIVMLAMGLLMTLSASAQFEQGKMYANAGFSSLDLNYTALKKWSFDVNGKVGYMFADDCMALADCFWGIHDASPNCFGLGAGVRYYIEQNGIYLGAGARYKHTEGVDDFLPNVNIGYSFFLSRTVTVEPELYYDISTKKFEDYSGFGFRIGFGIYLGKK
jgi:hypothetical protein